MKKFAISILCVLSAALAHAQTSALSVNPDTGAMIFDSEAAAQYANWTSSQFKINGTQLVATGKTPSFSNSIAIAGTDGKTLTLNQNLTLTGTSGKSLTLTGGLTVGADTTISGGGTLALGGFTFTVPATGTGVLTTRTLTAGAGLTGTGDLSADRTFNVGAGAGITVNADDVALTTPGTLGVGIGNSASGNHTHLITTTTAGSASTILALDTNADAMMADLLAKNSTFNLVNTTATTLNLGGAATIFNLGASTGTMTLGNSTVALSGTLLNPVTGYNTDIGQLSKKYKALYASELWVETLVAQNTIATIGGRVLVGPTTTLIADLSTGATTMDVKHNQMSNGDRVYLEANGSVEFLAVTSAPSTITGGYRYSITRNLDGTGANAWTAGDAVFNTGTTGNGFIDLYSVQAVKGGSQLGPTIVGNVRNSSTYNDWTEHWAIGNLVGLYGYGANTYGVGLGKYASGNANVTIDPTNGFRLRNFTNNILTLDATNGVRIFVNGTSTVAGQWALNGDATIGQTGSAFGNILAGANGVLYMRKGTTVLGYWDGNTGDVLFGQTGSGQSNVFITSGAVKLRNNTTDYISLDSSGNALFGLTTSSQGNVSISGGTVAIRRGTTDYITLSATDAQFANLIKMTGASAAISLGSTPPTSATVGTGIWLDRNGLYALSANTQNVTITSAGVTAGAGSAVLDANGLTFTPSAAVAFSRPNGIGWIDGSGFTAGADYATSSSTNTIHKSHVYPAGALTSGNWFYHETGTFDSAASATNGLALQLWMRSGGTRATYAVLYPAGLAAGNFTGLHIGSNTQPTRMLEVEGAGYFSNSLGVGGSATHGTLDVYGAGWFQGAVTLAGGVSTNYTVTGNGSFVPTAGGVTLAAVVTSGAFGGGFVLKDGTFYSGLWNDASILKLGTGSSSGLTANLNLKSTGVNQMPTYGAGTLTTDASGNITATSDERLKDIDATFTRGLVDLRGIRPVTYHWKESTGLDRTEAYTGFTAQNVLSNIPEAVSMNQAGNYTLDERPIVATLVNAVNELETRLAKLEGPAGSGRTDSTDRQKLASERAADLKKHQAARTAAEAKSRPAKPR